ncbi:MAG TPA: hypothetical protein VLT33_49505, partial [Labilithrix sp.]|nr:hypothetical protein [Labilithrix sp.]
MRSGRIWDLFSDSCQSTVRSGSSKVLAGRGCRGAGGGGVVLGLAEVAGRGGAGIAAGVVAGRAVIAAPALDSVDTLAGASAEGTVAGDERGVVGAVPAVTVAVAGVVGRAPVVGGLSGALVDGT